MLGDHAVLAKAAYLDARISYSLPVETPGMYRLGLQSSCGQTPPFVRPPVQIGIDGHRVGEAVEVAGGETLPEFVGYTSWLTEGDHLLELRIPPAYYNGDRGLTKAGTLARSLKEEQSSPTNPLNGCSFSLNLFPCPTGSVVSCPVCMGTYSS